MLLLNLRDRLFCLPHVAIASFARAAAVAMLLVHLTVSTAHAQKPSSTALPRDGAQFAPQHFQRAQEERERQCG